MKLTSEAFKNGRIDIGYGNLGDEDNMKYGIPQTSFPLEWEDAPEGTASFAIVFIDYDDVVDEGVPFIHWLVMDISSNCYKLAENSSREDPDYIQGHNSWCMPFEGYRDIPEDLSVHFGGPAPEYEHEYEVWLFALDCMSDLSEGFYFNEMRRAMEGHILDHAVLKGRYGN